MEKETISRRLVLTAAGLGAAALGLDYVKRSLREPLPYAARAAEDLSTSTATPEVKIQGIPTFEPTQMPEATKAVVEVKQIENLEAKQALTAGYQALLESDREQLNLFSKTDANIVILPLDESGQFRVDINGKKIMPAVSLIKTWVLLHGIFSKPWDLENVVNGEDAYRMMVDSNNKITAEYICKYAQNKEIALDEINQMLRVMGLGNSVGITNWTFKDEPTLISHQPLEEQETDDSRIIGVDNPTTLWDTVKTLSLMESEVEVEKVAAGVWELGYGKDHYQSFEDYVGDVKVAIAAAKVLMGKRSVDPQAKTEILKAIEKANFPEGSESDYGKGGTIGNLVEGWNRGRYVTEMRVITLRNGDVSKRYIIVYSAWSFRTETFLSDALSYMVKMTNISK